MMITRMSSGGKALAPVGSLLAAAASGLLAAAVGLAAPPEPDWPQWGRDAAHDGASPVFGQPLQAILADVVYDPFTAQEEAETFGDLLAHYAVALVDGGDIYMASKGGQYVSCNPPGSGQPFPCGPDAWNTQVWGVKKLRWQGSALVEQWTFASDWKPEPDAGGLGGWEPVFDPALAGDFLYVPGSGGTVHKVSKATGVAAAQINPFPDLNPTRYVAGGLAADAGGHVVYDAIQLDPADPWNVDVSGAWLVKVGPNDAVSKVDFALLVPGAPRPTDLCRGGFNQSEKPWPPTPTAVPPSFPCGSQRPGLNVVPAIAPDGTIYTVSRAHFNLEYGYLVAVRPDLTPAWSTSFRGFLNDGCGVLRPIGTSDPYGCRAGAMLGVDPQTNDRPAGRVNDAASSSPVVLPDGAVLFGAQTNYNYGRGHLFKFDSRGSVLATYDFGWDITPAVRVHDGSYSIVLKDNHYGPADGERYDITSLDPSLVPEWKFRATNTQSCARQSDGTIFCVDDHPAGFEWCVNQPAIDAAGVTYCNSEDGSLFAIGPDGLLRGSLFLNLALGAAYTPLSIGADGRIYAQNSGHLFVVGVPVGPRASPVPAGESRQTRVIDRP